MTENMGKRDGAGTGETGDGCVSARDETTGIHATQSGDRAAATKGKLPADAENHGMLRGIDRGIVRRTTYPLT